MGPYVKIRRISLVIIALSTDYLVLAEDAYVGINQVSVSVIIIQH